MLKTLIIAAAFAAGLVLVPTGVALSADAADAGTAGAHSDGASSQSANATAPDAGASPVKCKKAFVNPVTGSAFCVDPRGAPVAAPPVADLKPCKKRTHDKETGAVYERYSGCW